MDVIAVASNRAATCHKADGHPYTEVNHRGTHRRVF